MRYTVLLLVPDYLANTFGQDTFAFLADVEAPGARAEALVRVAVAEARDAALDAFNQDGFDPEEAKAFHVLAVYAGHHDDINPEA
jgi:hypothetical protein